MELPISGAFWGLCGGEVIKSIKIDILSIFYWKFIKLSCLKGETAKLTFSVLHHHCWRLLLAYDRQNILKNTKMKKKCKFYWLIHLSSVSIFILAKREADKSCFRVFYPLLDGCRQNCFRIREEKMMEMGCALGGEKFSWDEIQFYGITMLNDESRRSWDETLRFN